jgi:GNAT superfamily N-acetyltransferase
MPRGIPTSPGSSNRTTNASSATSWRRTTRRASSSGSAPSGFPRPANPRSLEERIVELAHARGSGPEPHAADYPAHLHIDLLPETQGQGVGRQLIETLSAELRRRGVPGVHLEVDPANTGAAAFYERIGMQRLATAPGGSAFGIRF